jgi:beta-N-acetylglucosaminidase/murein DD-endopeptidase MepM/ murein hydrolase activator NlpD
MVNTLERYAKEYRNRTMQGFARFENPIARLFGVEYIIIDSLIVETVDEQPGLYNIQMIMTSYNKTQNDSEKPKGFSPVSSKGSIDDLIDNDARNKWRETRYEQIVEDSLDSMDLYPDLELPTYYEYINAVNRINEFRLNNDLNEIQFNKIENENEINTHTKVKWIAKKDYTTRIDKNFKDVKEDFWAHDFIYDLANREVIFGYPDNTFKPNNDISRAEVASILVNITKNNNYNNIETKSFNDVDTDKWYFNAIEVAFNIGIMKGYPDHKFRPNNNTTREEVITAICNAKNVDYSIVDTSQLDYYYIDTNDISEYARAAITHATNMGWLAGYPDRSIRPKNKLTRAECATLISKAFMTTKNALQGFYELFNKDTRDRVIEPDFYFNYPTLKQTGLDQLMIQNDLLEKSGVKIENHLSDLIKGTWYKMVSSEGIYYNNKTLVNNKRADQYNSNQSVYITLDQMIDKQFEIGAPPQKENINKPPMWIDANREDVEKYLNPDKNMSEVNKYQFIDLSVVLGLTEEQINLKLEGKGILEGHGKDFVDAANKYSVSEAYLIGHALLETGNGTSTLSNGINVKGVTVYNMFGINADDDDPEGKGSLRAYDEGWTSVSKAIVGGAGWISKFYINHVNKQNTLYKMRWNPEYPDSTHQYATDIGWAVKQAPIIKQFYDMFPDVPRVYDIPRYGKYEEKEEQSFNTNIDNTWPSPLDGSRCDNDKSTGIPYITSRFRTQKRPNHNGIDIGVAEGTNLIAVKDGIVKFAGWQDKNDKKAGYGRYVIIQHDDNMETLYGHMSNIIVVEGTKVNQGDIVGQTGNTGHSSGPHLHYEVRRNGGHLDPEPYIIGKNGYIFKGAKKLTNINEINDSNGNSKGKPIDLSKLGMPIRKKIGEGFENTKDGLIERMFVDHMEYNRRGTMVRAFPSFNILFIDEGLWMDGRRLWSNYYLYNSIVDISVERDRDKSADTAIVNLTNIYNTLGTQKRQTATDDSWYRKFLESIEWYSDDILKDTIRNKNELLSSFRLRPGARIHIRIGYGNAASKLPVLFNGIITETNTDDIVTICAQSDGIELTSVPVGVDNEDDSTSSWDMGNEPHTILTHLLTTRSSEFLSRISEGRWGENSAYGIEHFGSFYFKTFGAQMEEISKRFAHDREKYYKENYGNYERDIFKDVTDMFKISTEVGCTIAGNFLAHLLKLAPNGTAMDELVSHVFYEDYDIMKNIYLANLELAKTGTKETGILNWFINNEDNLSVYTFNRTIWDIGRELACATPEFIFHPHNHQFRSTLFFGIPTWTVRYKYEYIHEDEVYEYGKSFSQTHLLSSMYDIIDNSIKAVSPECTMARTSYAGPDGTRKSTDVVYADRNIKNEQQKLNVITSGIKWSVTGVNWLDSFAIDNFVGRFIVGAINGDEPGKLFNRSIAVRKVQDSFKKIYQGALTILGDASIKPYDNIYVQDNYVGMQGNIEVRKVVHHFGLSTGFVTEITPDMNAVQTDVESYKTWAIQATSILATSVFFKFGVNRLAAKISKNIKEAVGIAQKTINSAKSWRSVKAVKSVGKDIKEGTSAFKQAVTNNAKISKNLKAIRLGSTRFAVRSSNAVFSGLRTGSKMNKAYKAFIGTKTGTNIVKMVPYATAGAKKIVTLASTIRTSLLRTIVSPAFIYAIIGSIIFEVIYRMFTSVFDYFQNKNVIKVYPLFYKDRPYIAGVDGHELLIPGYSDHNMKNNMEIDQENKRNEVIRGLTDQETEELLKDLANGIYLTEELSDNIKRNHFIKYNHIPWKKDGSEDLEYARNISDNKELNRDPVSVLPMPGNTTSSGYEIYRPLDVEYDIKLSPTDSIAWFGKKNMINQIKADVKTAPVFAFADGKVVSQYVTSWYEYDAVRKKEGFLETFVNDLGGTWKSVTDFFGSIIGKEVFNSLVIIEHDNITHDGRNKFYTLYFNLNSFNFNKGDVVKASECIGSTFGSRSLNLNIAKDILQAGVSLASGNYLGTGISINNLKNGTNPIISDNSLFGFAILGAGSNPQFYNVNDFLTIEYANERDELHEKMKKFSRDEMIPPSIKKRDGIE